MQKVLEPYKPCDHIAMIGVTCRNIYMLQARVTHRTKPCQTLETQLRR